MADDSGGDRSMFLAADQFNRHPTSMSKGAIGFFVAK